MVLTSSKGSVDASITDMKSWTATVTGENGAVTRYGTSGAVTKGTITESDAVNSFVNGKDGTSADEGAAVSFVLTGASAKKGYFEVTAGGKKTQIAAVVSGSDLVSAEDYIMPSGNISVGFVERTKVALNTNGLTVNPASPAYVDENGVVTFTVTASDADHAVRKIESGIDTGVTVDVKAGTGANQYLVTVTVPANKIHGAASQNAEVNEYLAAAAKYDVTIATSDSKIALPDEVTQQVISGDDAIFTVTSADGKSINVLATASNGAVVDVQANGAGTKFTITVENITEALTITVRTTASNVSGGDVTVPKDEIEDKFDGSSWEGDDTVVRIISAGITYVRQSDTKVTAVLEDPDQLVVLQIADKAGANDVLKYNGAEINQDMIEAIMTWANGSGNYSSSTMSDAINALGITGSTQAEYIIVIYVPEVGSGGNEMLLLGDTSDNTHDVGGVTLDMRELTTYLSGLKTA